MKGKGIKNKMKRPTSRGRLNDLKSRRNDEEGQQTGRPGKRSAASSMPVGRRRRRVVVGEYEDRVRQRVEAALQRQCNGDRAMLVETGE